MSVLRPLIHKFGKWYIQDRCRREYERQQFVKINERSVELQFVFQCLSSVPLTTVLDVGTGTTALPALLRNCGFLVTAIDNVNDYWVKGMFNRHYYVLHDDITQTKINKRFDFITCVSVIEHIKNHESAIQGMFSLLNPGGYLVLTFPYNETKYIDNAYKLPQAGYGQDNSYICQIFSRNEINSWLKNNNGKILKQEYWQIFSGDLWTFGELLHPPRHVDKNEKHQLACLLIQKN